MTIQSVIFGEAIPVPTRPGLEKQQLFIEPHWTINRVGTFELELTEKRTGQSFIVVSHQFSLKMAPKDALAAAAAKDPNVADMVASVGVMLDALTKEGAPKDDPAFTEPAVAELIAKKKRGKNAGR